MIFSHETQIVLFIFHYGQSGGDLEEQNLVG